MQAASIVQRVAQSGRRHQQAERRALGGGERQPVRDRAVARGARRLLAQERQGAYSFPYSYLYEHIYCMHTCARVCTVFTHIAVGPSLYGCCALCSVTVH